MHDLTWGVKQAARRMGFQLVGIAAPLPSAYARHYRDWLAQGYHADMAYLARSDAVAKRINPRSVMPEARSIVVVGMNYYPGDFPSTTGCQGRVSRYAWGADYHDVMMEMLQQLAAWIVAQVGEPVAHRAYVDFGPLMERELAQRAGLGWFGKNTTLIHPTLGSFFFLGELFVDVELEPDVPSVENRCGSCTACLDACPTGALVGPRLLDARRCISYLTIEHRGSIAKDLRPQMGDWVFGCDVCQTVCPWNKCFTRPTNSLIRGRKRPTLDLIRLLTLDEGTFCAHFRHTPLWRARRAGLLRNATVALGNLGARAAVPTLERVRSDDSPLVAEHAAWALQQIVEG